MDDDIKDDMVFLGLSDTELRNCLPHLDVGDAFDTLERPSLLGLGHAAADSQGQQAEEGKAVAARQELIDVLGGYAMLISGDEADVSFAPWSLRYSGHQFGRDSSESGTDTCDLDPRNSAPLRPHTNFN